MVVFDLTNHRGYYFNHDRVTGDVGMEVVAIDSAKDAKVLFDGITLNKFSVSMTMSLAVFTVMVIYIKPTVEQKMELGTKRRKYSEGRGGGRLFSLFR